MAPEIYLRDVTEADLDVLFEQQADPVAREAAGLMGREREAFDLRWAQLLPDDSVWKKAIVADGELAGHLAVFERSGKKEVGYWLGREYWGRGIISVALAELLRIVPVRPLFAHTAKHNRASVRALEKCGFVLAGEDPEFSTMDGRVIEGYIYRLDQTPFGG